MIIYSTSIYVKNSEYACELGASYFIKNPIDLKETSHRGIRNKTFLSWLLALGSWLLALGSWLLARILDCIDATPEAKPLEIEPSMGD